MQKTISVGKLVLVFCVLHVLLNIGDGAMKKVIDEIIKDFNFEKVYRAMVVVNWCWSSTHGVPSINELMLCAQELLNEASKMDTDCSIGTGGFRATKIENEDGEEGLQLEFILTESGFYTE